MRTPPLSAGCLLIYFYLFKMVDQSRAKRKATKPPAVKQFRRNLRFGEAKTIGFYACVAYHPHDQFHTTLDFCIC
jgi:hypothetical protein